MANIVDSSDKVWLDRSIFEEAEANFQQHLHQLKTCGHHSTNSTCAQPFSPIKKSISSEIAKARQHISETLTNNQINTNLSDKTKEENLILSRIQKLESAVAAIETKLASLDQSCKKISGDILSNSSNPAVPSAKTKNDEEEEDFELFGSDEEETNEEENRVRQERIQACEDKKSKKPQLIAKSIIMLDVKPWDDETDMSVLEQCVRSIEMDGLLWGSSKLVPLAYGIKKLQITCVVEDEKVSVDDLEEKIVAFEDHIQSMDIAAFNKI